MNPPLQVNETISIPAAELSFSFARSSGPGGQNVNKVNSKVWLRFDVVNSPSLPPDVRARFLSRYASRISTEGHILISSEGHRDRSRNMADACQRLAELIAAVATAPRKRHKTRPSRGAVERRLKQKSARSDTKSGRQRVTGQDG